MGNDSGNDSITKMKVINWNKINQNHFIEEEKYYRILKLQHQ